MSKTARSSSSRPVHDPGPESVVERYFLDRAAIRMPRLQSECAAVIVVENFAELGRLAALRFLEWAYANPGGIAALPTGKTPEFFIKWVVHYLENWNKETGSGILGKLGFSAKVKPDIGSLHFVQLDEYFPMNPRHECSFDYFVKKYYIGSIGFDLSKALTINTCIVEPALGQLPPDCRDLGRIFPDGAVDLGLRTKPASTKEEALQKECIMQIDRGCEAYEETIRQMGGIGFFLGGIGPDGHIAFNIRGSSFFSHTRLASVNYETHAAAAADLGGIENVRKKAVITIGLGTIVFNAGTIAIVIAAGEAKAEVIANTLEKGPSIVYPASCLATLRGARFFLTAGAATRLKKRATMAMLKGRDASEKVIERLMIDGAVSGRVPAGAPADRGPSLPEEWALAEKLTGLSAKALNERTRRSLAAKIQRGLNLPKEGTFLHTGPHHDDIELAYLPVIHHLVRSEKSKHYFCYCTSGFTSVTNDYVLQRLRDLERALDNEAIFRSASLEKLCDLSRAQEDITGFLNGIAKLSKEMQAVSYSCRQARLLAAHLNAVKPALLMEFVKTHIAMIEKLAPGRPVPKIVQQIKGWLREFEAELVWAHFGIGMSSVRHLRLQFYTADIFPQYPDYRRDVRPIIDLLEEVRPSIVTLALDPEGSGPDTHYKSLAALSLAIDEYVRVHKAGDLRVWGYRNIWTRFHPSDVNMIVPVSLNSFAVLHDMFSSCFLSQVSASFPSHAFDGPFNLLAQKIWVEQHNQLSGLLGREFFYENPNPMMRRSYGAIYIKDMSHEEFTDEIRPLMGLLTAKKGLREI